MFVYAFQVEKCSCQKGNCDTKSCSCRKNGRHCCSRCDCKLCKNRRNDKGSEKLARRRSSSASESSASVNDLEKMDVRNLNGEGSLSVNGVSAQPLASAANRTAEEETYDPKIHNAVWHNDQPFVLQLYNGKMKKCRGCGSEFIYKKESPKFVIQHEEPIEFWTNHGKRSAQRRAFYHCNASCISPRHPYFKSREVTAPPPVAINLTKEDAQLVSRFGVNLSFLRKYSWLPLTCD